MDWAKLAEAAAPAAITAAALIVVAAIGFIGGILGGRLNFRAEVMKLRHSIAERRVKEFDEAATDFLSLTTALNRRDLDSVRPLAEQYVTVSYRLANVATLAMMPEHDKMLEPAAEAFEDTCHRLCKLLGSTTGPLDGDGRRQYARCWRVMSATLSALMRAVDISAEARLEGKPSRGHTAAIKAIAENLMRTIREADEGSSADK